MTLCRPAIRLLLALLMTFALVPPCAGQRLQAGSRLKQLDIPLHDLPALPYGQRTDAFRRLLFELRFHPLHRFEDLDANPSESLLIVLGDPSCLSKSHFPKGLREFVKRGGAVLIATDYETEGEAGEMLKHLAGVTVTGETLVVRRIFHSGPMVRPFPRYDNSEYCPCLEPLEDSMFLKRARNVVGALATLLGAAGRPELFRRNLYSDQPNGHVATNAPSRLKVSGWLLPSGVYRLARLPPTCEDEMIEIDPSILGRQEEPRFVDENEPRFVDENGPLFAVGGTVGKGRVLVLADHSIFINRMILPRDNFNLEFAANCLHWLRGGVSTPMEALGAVNNPDALKQLAGSRNKVLFWDDGTIRTDFQVPLKTMPLKPSLGSEPAIVAAIDKTIANMEDNDFFNQQLLDGMDELPGGRPRVVRYVVYLLTLAGCMLLGYRFLWRSRHRPELAVPLLGDAVSQHEPRLSLLEQRRRALLRSGNVWEIAHRLAREYFESAGVPLSGNTLPRVEMKGGTWRQRWRINRRMARLWQLARGDAPVRIPPASLQRWLRELEELKTILTDGTIRLT